MSDKTNSSPTRFVTFVESDLRELLGSCGPACLERSAVLGTAGVVVLTYTSAASFY